jgi:uncharacterized DUF497 family protein
MRLIWDEENESHIAKHSVVWREAQEVVEGAATSFPKRIGAGRFSVRGQTARGRYLQVIYVVRPPDKIDPNELNLEDRLALEAGEQFGYVIHARDLGHGEKRSVRRRKG